MSFTDYLGRTWKVARVADIPFPTSTGGNTTGCPLDAVCKAAYETRGENVTSREIAEALSQRPQEIKECWHHRFTRAEHLYIAELSCWFVEHSVQPYSDSIIAVVKRDGLSEEVADTVCALFDDELHWSFVPGEHLGNGRHRLCALKANRIPRVAIQV
jgi:hypothetical protein